MFETLQKLQERARTYAETRERFKALCGKAAKLEQQISQHDSNRVQDELQIILTGKSATPSTSNLAALRVELDQLNRTINKAERIVDDMRGQLVAQLQRRAEAISAEVQIEIKNTEMDALKILQDAIQSAAEKIGTARAFRLIDVIAENIRSQGLIPDSTQRRREAPDLFEKTISNMIGAQSSDAFLNFIATHKKLFTEQDKRTKF